MTVPGFGFAQGSENSGHLPVFPHHMCLELGAWSCSFPCGWGMGALALKVQEKKTIRPRYLPTSSSQRVCLLVPGAEA